MKQSVVLTDGLSDSHPLLQVVYERIFHFIEYFFSSCIKYSGGAGANISALYYYVQWFIVTVQCCRYMTNHYIGYEFNSVAMDNFHKLVEFVSFFPSFGIQDLPYLLACLSVAATALIIIFSALAHRYLNWTFQFHIARTTVLLLPYLLFVPISEALLQVIVPCFSADRHPLLGSGCWEGTHALQASVAFVALGLLYFFSLLADQCFYAAELSAELNINPITHGCNGVSDNTHLSWLRTGSLVLSTLFLAADDDSWRLPLALLYFIASAGLFTKKYLVLPHYNDFAQALHLARTLAVVLTGAVMLISASRTLEGSPAHQHDLVVLYLVSMPLTVVIGMLAVTHRYAHVGSAPAQELTTPSLMILAARARLRRFLLQIAAHGDAYVADSAYLQEERLAMSQDFDGLLTVALGRFPDSAPMRIFAALFYTHVLDNRNLAYAQLKELPPREDLPLRHAFLVGQLRALLDAATQKHQSLEVQAYIEFKRRKEVVDAASMGCLASLLSFWTELLHPLPDVDALITLAVAARAQLQTCHVNYKALLEINPNSVPVLRTYGLLLLDLVGDLPRASALFARADTVERERSVALMSTAQSGDFLSRVDTNLDIFDERNAVFGISVERARMGEVETINPAVTRMFGLQGKDIVGGNISRIIPSPIAEVHNDILERYLVHKTSRIVNYTRMAFGLHASGYIFPTHLYVRWADEGNAKFLGVLQSVPLDNDVHLMLDSSRRTVAYSTPNANSLLGLSLRATLDGSTLAESLLPCLGEEDAEARFDAMRSRLGLECLCRHALTGALSPCRVWCVETTVMGRRVVFLRVLLDMAARAEAEEQAREGWESDENSEEERVSLADRFSVVLEDEERRSSFSSNFSDSLPSRGGRPAPLASVPESSFEANTPRGQRSISSVQIGVLRRPTDTGSDSDSDRSEDSDAKPAVFAPKPETGSVLAVRTASPSTAGRPADAASAAGTAPVARGNMQSSALKRLRKAVRVHQQLLGVHFLRARVVLVALLCLLVGVLVAHHVLLRHYNAQLDHDVAIAHANAERVVVALDGVYHHRSLRLHEEHPAASPLFERDYVLQEYSAGAAVPTSGDTLTTLLKRRTLQYLNHVSALSQFMAASRSATYLRFMDVEDTMVPLPALAPDGLSYESNVMNIDEAAFRWLAVGRATLDPPDGSRADILLSSVFDASGYGGIMNLSSAYAAALHRGIAADGDDLYMWSAVVAAAALVLIVAVGALAVLPAVRAVEAAKTEVLELFLDVPAEVRRLVRKRLLGLRGLLMDREAGGDAVEGGGEHWMGEAHKEGSVDYDTDDEDDDGRSVTRSLRTGSSFDDRPRQSFSRHSVTSSALLLQSEQEEQALVAKGNGRSSGASSVDLARSQMRQQCYAKFAENRAPAPSAAMARYGKLAAKGLAGRPDLLFHSAQSRADAGAQLDGALTVDLGKISRAAAAAATLDGQKRDDLAAAALAKEHARIAAHREESARRAATRQMAVFSLLLALFAVHAGVFLAQVHAAGASVSRLGHLIEANASQASLLSHALFAARENLFHSFATLQAADPLSPFLSQGPFPAVVQADLTQARAAHRSVVYGDDAGQVQPQPYRALTDPINYGSLCALAPKLAQYDVIGAVPAADPDAASVFADVWGACASQLSGALVKGFDALMLFACDSLEGFADNPVATGSFQPYLTAMPAAGPSPADGPAFSVFSGWHPFERLVLDYVTPAVLLMGAEFKHAAEACARDAARNTLVLSVCVGIVAVALAFFVFRAQLQRLQAAAAHATGALLLLTPELTRTVPKVALYVQDHCSRE